MNRINSSSSARRFALAQNSLNHLAHAFISSLISRIQSYRVCWCSLNTTFSLVSCSLIEPPLLQHVFIFDHWRWISRGSSLASQPENIQNNITNPIGQKNKIFLGTQYGIHMQWIVMYCEAYWLPRTVKLSTNHLLFIWVRRLIIQGLMQSLSIIEYFNVIKDRWSGLVCAVEGDPVDQFVLEVAKEALSNCVVPAITLATHTGDYAVILLNLLIPVCGVGRSSISMMNQARIGFATVVCHMAILGTQYGIHGHCKVSVLLSTPHNT